MPTTCGFPNCKFRSRYRGFEDNRHFYRVPKKPAILRHKWLEAIERTEATIVSQLRICSGHFHGGEKREGDIPVADPAVDPPRRIELPPKGVRFSSRGMSRAFKAHFRQSSTAISASSSSSYAARSNRGGGLGTSSRPSGHRYKPAEYAGAYKTNCSRPTDVSTSLTLHGFYPITSRIFPSSSSGTRTPSVGCLHQQGRQQRMPTNKPASFNPEHGVILPPSSFLPPLSSIFRPERFQNAFNGGETTSTQQGNLSFLDALDTKHLPPLFTDMLKSGLQALESGTTPAATEFFAKQATPDLMLPEFNSSMVLLWNSLRSSLQTPTPLNSLPPLAAANAAATASLRCEAPCVYGNVPIPCLTSGFERKELLPESVWFPSSCASARKCPTRSAVSLDNALDQEASLPLPRSPADSAARPAFCENRGEQPVAKGRSLVVSYKGNRPKRDENTTLVILGGPTNCDVESQVFEILSWIRTQIRIVHLVAGQGLDPEVLKGPILVIVYDSEGVSIDMLAQMDTLQLIVLADLSSGVDRNDAVANLLGSLGVPITVVSPQTDIDATADALFTYIALLNQPVVAPRYQTMPEPEAPCDSQARYRWGNCPAEASTGPSLTGPVTPSPRLLQADVGKELLWATAEKRQSLGERTLGLVGLDHIGLALARRARAFGMQILVYDPHMPEGSVLGFGLQQVGHLSYLLAESDVISIHWKPRSLGLQSADVLTERDQVEPVNLDSAFLDAMKKDSILLCPDNDGTLDVKELGARLKDGRLSCAVLLDRVIAKLPLHSQAALNELDNFFRLRSANLLTRRSLFTLRRQAAMAALSFLLSKRSDWSEMTELNLLSGRQHAQASSTEACQVKPRRRTAEHRGETENQADSLTHRTCSKPGYGNVGVHEEGSREFSAPLYNDKPAFMEAARRNSFSIKALVTECNMLSADELRSSQPSSTVATGECSLSKLQPTDVPMSFPHMSTAAARVIKTEHKTL